jgi:hypothetical protein
MRDSTHHISPVITQVASAKTATANGTGADLQGFESATAVVQFGTVTDGTHTPSLEESDDNATFTPVAAGQIIGTPFAAVTSGGGGSATQQVGYTGYKRYIRVKLTVAGATTGALSSAVVLRARPRHVVGTIA